MSVSAQGQSTHTVKLLVHCDFFSNKYIFHSKEYLFFLAKKLSNKFINRSTRAGSHSVKFQGAVTSVAEIVIIFRCFKLFGAYCTLCSALIAGQDKCTMNVPLILKVREIFLAGKTHNEAFPLENPKKCPFMCFAQEKKNNIPHLLYSTESEVLVI